MEIEQTLILVKPDGVQRGLIGEIISRYERKGLKLIGLKLLQLPLVKAEELYAIHKEQPFYDRLIEFMTSTPIVAMAVEGKNAIKLARLINGVTDPLESAPGSIRGDYSTDITYNLVHASDCLENAKSELAILFSPEELC
ncbi:MAG: nucleoside-diphosphate kinase [Candidatus Poribacteria bacterium]|nr:nucleoside-diphosphate kinase [Candidatus Poribacteria bacterium]MDE0317865.1 nucleoside-diphosphate kinase [Candidatus Poribacteria bacterium]MDE0485332.1 nucleoside-diphosphate kinase [Candidatus Poribacteria bacterium]